MAGAALSPDESRIIFRPVSRAGIWIVNTTGEQRRKLLDVSADGAHDSRLAWFPDGQRIAFTTASAKGNDFAIESYELNTGRRSVILSDPKGGDFCLTRDGRIIYTRLEVAPNEKSSNLWEVPIDLRTANVRGAPRRLTNWPDFLFSSLGASADGRRLFFLRLHYQNSVYMGELDDNGTRLTHARRFSFEQWTNWPTGWSENSRAVFFNSDRDGHPDIFEQTMAARDVRRLAAGEDERRDARLSPDGRSILYFQWPRTEAVGGQGYLMRADLVGGQAQALFPVTGYSRPRRIDPLVSISAEGYPAFRCPSATETPCVLSEELGGEIVFTSFDPLRGRGAKLASMPSGSFSFWDLSSDGHRIALGKNEETKGLIRLLSLTGKPSREVPAGDWTHLLSVAWSHDGSALFVTAFASKGAPLLRVSLDGKAQLLYRGLKYVENPVVSPNGRYLAFGEMTEDGNAWVMDRPR
jgi:Tol biopolymer transport system component